MQEYSTLFISTMQRPIKIRKTDTSESKENIKFMRKKMNRLGKGNINHHTWEA
jgi:hypothetical protein